jgi:hypothetical protein
MTSARAERIAALEQRIAVLEKRAMMAQMKIVHQLAKALNAIAHRERQEQIKVEAALRGLVDEVGAIRGQVKALTTPQTPN